MTFIFYFVLALFIVLCALISVVVLIQESKSLGLGASFGGDSGDSVFGTSTAEVLKKFTAYLAIAFAATCVILSLWTSSIGRHRIPVIPSSIEETSPDFE